MSAIIIGGSECTGRTCCDLCAKYNITARRLEILWISNPAPKGPDADG